MRTRVDGFFSGDACESAGRPLFSGFSLRIENARDGHAVPVPGKLPEFGLGVGIFIWIKEDPEARGESEHFVAHVGRAAAALASDLGGELVVRTGVRPILARDLKVGRKEVPVRVIRIVWRTARLGCSDGDPVERVWVLGLDVNPFVRLFGHSTELNLLRKRSNVLSV